jgi:translation initiation factor 2 subunit 1
VPFFNDIVNGSASISDYAFDSKIAPLLEETIRQRVKMPEVVVEGEFTISCYEDRGIELIKEAFLKIDSSKLNPFYLGSGRYHISVKSLDYKSAEDILNNARDIVLSSFEKQNAVVAFNRIVKKK